MTQEPSTTMTAIKVIVEFTLDETWEDYNDCSDEIVFTDLKETKFQGYSDVKLINIERT